MKDLLCMPLYHSLQPNQMGYMKVKAYLPGIYDYVNQPRPRAMPSESVVLLP